MVSDNGPPFPSAEFELFLSNNGIKHVTSALYHPQSNGEAENSVKNAKHKLRSLFRDNVNVPVALSRMLFDYRNSFHSTTKETPAKLMFNTNLSTRFDLLRPNIGNHVSQKQEKQKSYLSGKNTKYFNINQTVIVKDYGSNNKWVKGTI